MTAVLTDNVLVLNAGWTLIGVTSVWRALIKVCTERAQIVDRDYSLYDIDEWGVTWRDAARFAKEAHDRQFIGIVGGRIAAPEVIKQNHYNGYHRSQLKLSRRAVFERDDYTCQYCGKPFQSSELNLDHVVPKSRGGKDTWTNLVLSCMACNTRKRARTPAEAGMKLRRPPFEPTSPKPAWHSKLRYCRRRPEFWEHFLDKMYWEVTLEED